MYYKCKLCRKVVKYRGDHLMKKHPRVKGAQLFAEQLVRFDPVIRRRGKWIKVYK